MPCRNHVTVATSQTGLCPVGTMSLWLHPNLGYALYEPCNCGNIPVWVMPCRNPVTVATSQSGLCPVGTLSLWLHPNLGCAL